MIEMAAPTMNPRTAPVMRKRLKFGMRGRSVRERGGVFGEGCVTGQA
jgi:hypothetical protein